MILTRIQVRVVTKKRVEVTFVPTRLGLFLGLRIRRGMAERAMSYTVDGDGCRKKDGPAFFWIATDRYVGRRIERHIEAAPLTELEDLPIDLLLGDSTTPETR